MFTLYQLNVSDDSVRLYNQLDMRGLFYTLKKSYSEKVEQIIKALSIDETDWAPLKTPIILSPERADFTKGELQLKYAELLETALVYSTEISEKFFKKFTDQNPIYKIPTNMEYLTAYLQTKGRIILRLFSDPKKSLSQVTNFKVVCEKLTLFFQEINTFHNVLEKQTNVNFDNLIEKKLKSPVKDGLLELINFLDKSNEVWRHFGTVSKFEKFLADISEKSNTLPNYEATASSETYHSDWIIQLVDQSANFPITDMGVDTLIGKDCYISRDGKQEVHSKTSQESTLNTKKPKSKGTKAND